MSWKAISPSRFVRPLGTNEEAFHWDGQFAGTADCAEHAVVLVSMEDLSIFEDQKVARAWCEMKQRFPLLGAQIELCEDGSNMQFVVDRRKLQMINPGELSFASIASQEGATAFIDELLNGPRQLSPEVLAQLFILRREDDPTRVHIVVQAVHSITDGSSDTTLLRALLETLARSRPHPIPPLEQRLCMVVAAESLQPSLAFSRPRQQWRWAIAKILNSLRPPMQGGHALPRKVGSASYRTPAKSCIGVTYMTEAMTSLILANCKKLGITLGSAHSVLAQIAMARVLWRRYLRGEIPEAEWLHRRRQPTHTGGPLNLRPFLDQDWYKINGGGGEICLSIGFFLLTLPFMPGGSIDPKTATMDNGAPSLSALLSPARFVHRCNFIKAQFNKLLGPLQLYLERSSDTMPVRLDRLKNSSQHWRLTEDGLPIPQHQIPAPLDVDGAMVLTHGGSSFGNIDAMLPTDYPIPPTSPLSPLSTIPSPLKAGYAPPDAAPTAEPVRLKLLSSRLHLHCRPTELYLGAVTQHKMLSLHVFYDGNVYEKEVAHEWLAEVKAATVHYLGQEIQA